MSTAAPGASARNVADDPPSATATRRRTESFELLGSGYTGTRLPDAPISSVMCTSIVCPTCTVTVSGGSTGPGRNPRRGPRRWLGTAPTSRTRSCRRSTTRETTGAWRSPVVLSAASRRKRLRSMRCRRRRTRRLTSGPSKGDWQTGRLLPRNQRNGQETRPSCRRFRRATCNTRATAAAWALTAHRAEHGPRRACEQPIIIVQLPSRRAESFTVWRADLATSRPGSQTRWRPCPRAVPRARRSALRGHSEPGWRR